MIGTDFRSGAPIWIDLGSPDTDAATAFYEAVFGWRFVSAGPDAEEHRYGFFQKDGKTVGALGLLTEEGATSAWMTYFHSDDIQATARDVVARAGTVRGEPFAGRRGWVAQFTDPQGAEFAVLQPGHGLEKASEDDTLGWVELRSGVPETSIAFYSGLFGWRSEEMQTSGTTYRILSVKDGDQQEGAFGGVVQIQGDEEGPRWVLYFAVADVDATVTAVRDNGGAVLVPAADIAGVGRIAWLADRSQAVFAVLKPSPPQG
ncbi:VOC family protein [Amycolatopsis speibonae]|uniref:VOC family protein n=1 Tax=Amycolatopsis speibonae TaxID=1450224 RepID=A0ABV7PBK9_9PSEU